jgi:hypothetical protein
MVSEKELKEYKAIIQKIIDKHIPEEKRFSVEKLNQEQIRYLTRILLAKTQEEREKIRKEIEGKRKQFHKYLLKQVEDIEKYKENFDTIHNSIDDIRSLKRNMDLDSKLDADLDSALKK